MKTDIYVAHAMWMHIYYLIMFSEAVSEINVTYPHFIASKAELTEVLLLPRFIYLLVCE